MRVLINGLSMAGAKTGIGHYTAELYRSLLQQVGTDEIGCFPAPWVRRARGVWARVRPLVERATPSPSQAAAGKPAPAFASRSTFGGLRSIGQALLTRHFRAICRKGRFDLYHEPNLIPFRGDLPTVTTLHDLGVLLHPEWHPSDRVAHYVRNFRQGIERSIHFITVSDFGRREVIESLGLAPERVTRIYQGIRPNLRPLPGPEVRMALDQLGLPPRYLLSVGTIEPRKNVLTLLRAYCALPVEVRDAYPLLLVGGWGWNSADVATYLDSEARHKNVRHVGYLPERYLCALYNGARALAFPSLYEGFGLPPLEMMACGGAVLASTADALEETVGGQAHLVAPHDLDGWREALLRVTCDDDWWHQLRLGGEDVARPFTWERCAAETLALYRSLAGCAAPASEPTQRKAG
jgi:glycosyltransferase involved in cell wall biosynthesis